MQGKHFDLGNPGLTRLWQVAPQLTGGRLAIRKLAFVDYRIGQSIYSAASIPQGSRWQRANFGLYGGDYGEDFDTGYG